jgi:hypothetical protein
MKNQSLILLSIGTTLIFAACSSQNVDFSADTAYTFKGDWDVIATSTTNPSKTYEARLSIGGNSTNGVSTSRGSGKTLAGGNWKFSTDSQFTENAALIGGIYSDLDIGMVGGISLGDARAVFVATDQDGKLGVDSGGRSLFLGKGIIYFSDRTSDRLEVTATRVSKTNSNGGGGIVSTSIFVTEAAIAAAKLY